MLHCQLFPGSGLPLALYPAEDSPKFGKAATRWLGRLALESDDLSLDNVQLAGAALQALPRRPDSSLQTLTELSRYRASATAIQVFLPTPLSVLQVVIGFGSIRGAASLLLASKISSHASLPGVA